MALPTPDDLKGMDYAYQGEPFVRLPAKTGLTLEAMDYAYQAEPFVVQLDASAVGTNMQINIGDAWKTVSGVQINIGDSWKTVTKVQINIGDAWKTVFG